MSLRSISLTLYQRLAAAAGNSNKTTMVTSSSVSSTVRISNEDENNDEENTPIRKEGGEDPNKDLPSERVLLEFMRLAGEPITYIEARELWNDMRSTNNGSLPRFQDMMMDSSMHSLRRLSTSKSLVGDTGHSLNSPSHHTSAAADDDALNSDSILQENETQPRIDQGIMETLLHMTGSVRNLSDEELSLFCEDLASQIKAAYSIRHSSDRSEFKFCVGSLVFLWSVSLATIAASFFFPTHAALGKFSSALLVESFSLFAIELVWECILSWVVLKYNLKINYTRKLGNLVKVSFAHRLEVTFVMNDQDAHKHITDSPPYSLSLGSKVFHWRLLPSIHVQCCQLNICIGPQPDTLHPDVLPSLKGEVCCVCVRFPQPG